MDRYEFLTELHRIVKPRAYLEIGTQTGASLTLAKDAKIAVGVDPEMGNLTHDCTFATLCETTSDEFFEAGPVFEGSDGNSQLDLVFIDGLHHSEQVWRDFYHAAEVGHEKTIYVFDDVLPRNQVEAAREMCPGDWTGDVWKIISAISPALKTRPRLLVDTFPTGIMVISGKIMVDFMRKTETDFAEMWKLNMWQVPDWILNRDPDKVLQPGMALDVVTSWLS